MKLDVYYLVNRKGFEVGNVRAKDAVDAESAFLRARSGKAFPAGYSIQNRGPYKLYDRVQRIGNSHKSFVPTGAIGSVVWLKDKGVAVKWDTVSEVCFYAFLDYPNCIAFAPTSFPTHAELEAVIAERDEAIQAHAYAERQLHINTKFSEHQGKQLADQRRHIELLEAHVEASQKGATKACEVIQRLLLAARQGGAK